MSIEYGVDYKTPKNYIHVYEDDGCDLFNFCLSCPLPQCKYDLSVEKQLRLAYLLRILDLWETGDYTVRGLALKLKVGLWTVQMAIKYEGRKEELEPYRIVERLFNFPVNGMVGDS